MFPISSTKSRAIYIVPKNHHNFSNSPRIGQQRSVINKRTNILPQLCDTQTKIIKSANSTSKNHSIPANSFNSVQRNVYLDKKVKLTNILPQASLIKRNYQNGDDDINIKKVYNLIEDNPFNTHLNSAPRKRERLNNLTAEEKLNRRKMKNRVAAQTARDRKKERSHRLEEAVENLLSESALLRAENCNLLNENQRLRRENEALLNQSNQNTNNGNESLSVIPMQQCLDSLNTFGSAESINESLPRKQVLKANQTNASLMKTTDFRNLLPIICPFLILLSTIIKFQKATTMNFKPYSQSFLMKRMLKVLMNFVMNSSMKNFSTKIQQRTTKTLLHRLQMIILNFQSNPRLSSAFKALTMNMKRRRAPWKLYNGWGPPPLWKANN